MAILHLLLLKAISYRFVGLLSETKLRNINMFILFYTSLALTSPPFSIYIWYTYNQPTCIQNKTWSTVISKS